MFKSIKIEKINDLPECDIGAPIPTIISDEFNVYLFYFHSIHDPYWDGTYVNVRNSDDTGIVCVEFKMFSSFKFGGPNDEAMNGHPLFKYGLEAYKFQKVINSPWIEQIRKINSVHPQHNDSMFSNLSHFIYFFHDTCFEIVCSEYKYEIIKNKIMIECIKEKLQSLKI
ncbi:MAG: hypothetical protein ACO1NV_03010 [Leptospira bouyouniensis]